MRAKNIDEDTVHPHTCGANALFLSLALYLARFIPTHVGLMNAMSNVSNSRTVHPHTCGANEMVSSTTVALHGSSPHMWG